MLLLSVVHGYLRILRGVFRLFVDMKPYRGVYVSYAHMLTCIVPTGMQEDCAWLRHPYNFEL